jgi:pyoverdine/dityrosine biosynthesis protein Dit1
MHIVDFSRLTSSFAMTSIESPQLVTMAENKAAETEAMKITTTEISDLSVSELDAAAKPNETMANTILGIIEQYGLNHERTGSWEGFQTFFPIVSGQVSRGEPIKMLLPGFPFKSPNSRDKVLSNLPDLGEELALKHLNGLCENIRAVYEHGAEIHITSDGLVYNGTLVDPRP